MGTSASKGLCQTCIKPDQEVVTWKCYFLKECRDLKAVCLWTEELSILAEGLKVKPVYEHYHDVYILNQLHKNKNMQSICGQAYGNQLSLSPDNVEAAHYSSKHFSSSPMNSSKEGRASFQSNCLSAPSQTYLDHLLLKKEQVDWPQGSKDEAAANMAFFNNLTRMIDKQLNDKSNQLSVLCQAFVHQIDRRRNDDIEVLIMEVQQFSRVLWQTALSYYDLNILRTKSLTSSFYVTDDAMLGFFVSFIVGHEEIHQALLDGLQKQLRDSIHANMKRMTELSGVTTQDCEIGVPFRLDMSTYYHLQHSNPNKQLMEYRPMKPFRESIINIKKIEQKRSIMSKIKCILKMQEGVLKSVRRFYRDYECEFDGVLDSDNLMAIQLYILLKAQVLQLEVHLKLIERMATNKVINGTGGYYLISLQASYNYLEQFHNNINP